jgi:predicted dehydrogenase
LIGAGQIARQHLNCLRELPEADVVAVCDLSGVAAEMVASRYDVPFWLINNKNLYKLTNSNIIHITTPPTSHFPLASASLEAGAHVIVEKPATRTLDELAALVALAAGHRRALIENYNYLYNKQIMKIREILAETSESPNLDVEITINLNIAGDGAFADQDARHPALSLSGGAIADFLPHLASLSHALVGGHRAVRTLWTRRSRSPLRADEFRALVEAERGTALLGLSAGAQPDAFLVRVYSEQMTIEANLFETSLTIDRVRGGPRPLRPLWNALERARAMRRDAVAGLIRKLSGGPGAYEGLWELLRRCYTSFAIDSRPPVSSDDLLAVNRLVAELQSEISRFDTRSV